MERQLISISVPNGVSIAVMTLVGLVVWAIGAQLWRRFSGRSSSAPANNAGGY